MKGCVGNCRITRGMAGIVRKLRTANGDKAGRLSKEGPPFKPRKVTDHA